MNAPRLGGEKQEAKSNEKMAVGSYVKDKSRMKEKAKTQEAKWHIEDEIKNQKPNDLTGEKEDNRERRKQSNTIFLKI